MGVVGTIAGLGVILKRAEDGELVLFGLQQLSLENRDRALCLARENRLLILAELWRCGRTLSNPLVAHYRAHCPNYWHGCEMCPDYVPRKLEFCRRHTLPWKMAERWLEVTSLQQPGSF